MHSKTIEKLEFEKIKEILRNFAITESGKKYIDSMNKINNKSYVKKALSQVTEAVSMLYRVGGIPINEKVSDITFHIKLLSNFDSLNIYQLLDLLEILKVSQNLKQYFFNDVIIPDDYSNLSILFENLYTNPGIVQTLSDAIIDENTISDSASSELKNIRDSIRKKENEIKNKLQSLLHSKYIQEPIITIRNSRYVIPVKSEYRSDVKGFVHDISTSGSSIFIEPMAIFEINNEINQLHNDEKIEIEKILQKLSSLFFELTDNLQNTFNLIVILDFIFAKAKFSKTFELSEPVINDQKYINLVDCFHPLIPKETVVKNTISLGKDFNTLIITGPNTGGKTVILKTVGIINLMASYGLHIPAKPGSSIYLFDEIFADIGDEQSISDSLSTFSAHITNIAYILNNATPNSLVLIDELGSGTDPIEGSSLAISIIEYLNKNKILSIITTHYHEIKTFAISTPGLKNASVEFDLEKLLPTYKLLIGVPGRSNAFVISKKLGISDEIIENAKKYINSDTNNIEDLLNKIYRDKQLIENEKMEIENNLKQTTELKNILEKQHFDLKKQETDIINKAKSQAKNILLDAKSESDEIIKEIEKSNNAKTSNNLRKTLNKKIKDLSSEKTIIQEFTPIQENQLKIGLNVYIPSLNQNGTVISSLTKDNTVQIQIGAMKMNFKISDISLSNNSSIDKSIPKSKPRNLRTDSVSPEINVIGQNVEEACFTIDKYLDNCALNGLNSVRIIHGKGSGALRKGIQNYLKTHPHVKNYRIGTFGEGEMGVTIVELK